MAARLRDVAWFALPLGLCPLIALLRPGEEQTAIDRAQQLLAWERAFGIAIEASVHEWVEARGLLAAGVEAFYFGAHLSAIIATACWLAVRHRTGFLSFRRQFAVAQVLTACTYVLLPVAPLRMLLSGDSASAGASWTRSLQYEFAAMPSGHVVFAAVVAIAIWRHAPRRWRWIAIAHPACTTLAVVASAHHMLVDVAGALVIAAVAVRVIPAFGVGDTTADGERT